MIANECNYYLETPSERRSRRHEEDKTTNPDRHFFEKDCYSLEQIRSSCFECFEKHKHKYEILLYSMEIVKKKSGFDYGNNSNTYL